MVDVKKGVKSNRLNALYARLIKLSKRDAKYDVAEVIEFALENGLIDAEFADTIREKLLKRKAAEEVKNPVDVNNRFHGNDIKKLCAAVPDLASVSDDVAYQAIIHAMIVFDGWARMVSSTKTKMTELEIARLCCRQHTEQGCCRTILLAEALGNVGGFGSSVLVHAVVMHLGDFLWTHRFIGAAAEEGIEAVHCRLAAEFNRHKRKPMERLLNAVKWIAIDTFLCDAGEF